MLSEQTYQSLKACSKGQLTKLLVDNLLLPVSTEVNMLGYLATRLKPTMQSFTFRSVEQALQSIAEHYATHRQVVAKVSARSNRAIDALTMTDESEDISYENINPWTYGAN